jgi:hypothetical protein
MKAAPITAGKHLSLTISRELKDSCAANFATLLLHSALLSV